jgi:Glycosyltransferase family 9 (heptosyltransferase)
MQKSKLPSNSQYVIITVKQPVMLHQTEDETWLLNPNRRYIFNAARIPVIHEFIESVSELDGASLYTRLVAGKDVSGAKILVERYRERGIGDLLFLTGPLGFINHVSGQTASVDLYALSDRGGVLTHSPLVNNKTVLCGPLEYDHLRLYNYHWLVGSVTECDEEQDQLNVYDALFRQLNFDPENIEPRWKRPSATVVADDFRHLDQFFKTVFDLKKIDLRKIGYYVVAPFANSSLRCANYKAWLEIIRELGRRRPTLVVGNTALRLPDTDISVGTFQQELAQSGGGVINAIDATPLRVLMALIARATCVFCLDSAPLYIAQALNTPAISLWGTHDPGVRIGYDKNYLDLAIWNEPACKQCPCFAYSEFPAHKCPKGSQQIVCEVLASVETNQVLNKVDSVESSLVTVGKFQPK